MMKKEIKSKTNRTLTTTITTSTKKTISAKDEKSQRAKEEETKKGKKERERKREIVKDKTVWMRRGTQSCTQSHKHTATRAHHQYLFLLLENGTRDEVKREKCQTE